MMEYQNFIVGSKEEVEVLLKSGDTNNIIKALIGMVNGINDAPWLQEKLLAYVNHEDYWVAKNAITGLSDVVRIHGRIDKPKVLKELQGINEEKLQDIIKNTLDDIYIFSG